MICCSNDNLAVDLDLLDSSNLDNKNNTLTPKEQEFNKLLREYINSIKVYIGSNAKII